MVNFFIDWALKKILLLEGIYDYAQRIDSWIHRFPKKWSYSELRQYKKYK
jgi:hypothetical protein